MVLVGLTMLPLPPPPATASCAAARLVDVEDLVLERGASATVEGEGFVDGCGDAGDCGLGCGECETEEETPYRDIELRLVQRGRTFPLGIADAGSAADDELGQVTWTFLVPRPVEPGPARLMTDVSEPARIRIR